MADKLTVKIDVVPTGDPNVPQTVSKFVVLENAQVTFINAATAQARVEFEGAGRVDDSGHSHQGFSFGETVEVGLGVEVGVEAGSGVGAEVVVGVAVGRGATCVSAYSRPSEDPPARVIALPLSVMASGIAARAASVVVSVTPCELIRSCSELVVTQA